MGLSRNTIVALSLFAVVACDTRPIGSDAITDDPNGRATAPIIGGQATTGDPAVVLLVSYPSDHSYYDTCTASLIAPTVLLTAGHCVDAADHSGNTFGVFPGPDASSYTTLNSLIPHLLAVSEVHEDPSYDPNAPFTADIGVAILAAPLNITPLPIFREAPAPALVGQPARIVGYGQAVYGQFSATKRTATTVLAAIDSGDTVTVGDNVKHSCVGDSGGPALMEQNGVETIVGADSYTDLTGCVGPAHYRRTDLYLSFLDQYAPPTTTTTTTSSVSGSGGGPATSTASESSVSSQNAVGSGEGGSATHSGDGGASSSEGGSSGCSIAKLDRRDVGNANALYKTSGLLFVAMALSIRRNRRHQPSIIQRG